MQNMSFVLGQSRSGNVEQDMDMSVKMGNEPVDVDQENYSVIMGIEDDISPIHNPLDTSLPMAPPKPSKQKKNLQTRRNEKKGAIQINLSFDNDDSGY